MCAQQARKTHLLESVLLASAVSLVPGCDIQTTVSARSGTLKDDYVEEPLAENTRKYAAALDTSNKLLELFSEENYETLYDDYGTNEFKASTSRQQLEAFHSGITEKLGPITGYKPMQWDFESSQVVEKPVIVSTKIVQHQKGKLKYRFVFKEGSAFKKVITLKVDSYVPP
jgi:hypothetical protein